MGRRSYPPLKQSEVVAILESLNFTTKRTKGSHRHYEGMAADGKTRAVVTVDLSIPDFNEYLLKSMIRQCGHDRKAFYNATPGTARKIR
jgi:predicted RNA binding protein YcfA (HicA-like mRNA interferase family)